MPARLGDSITAVTSAVGMPPCAGCKRRAEALNRMSEIRRPDRRAGQRGDADPGWDLAARLVGSLMIGAGSLALRRLLR
jgi:hypothetical protein